MLRKVPKSLAVSPACAGMDRYRCFEASSKPRFPRMCGDGPQIVPFFNAAIQFPPHVRGWTRRHRLKTLPNRVSPACAGMDPS